MKYLFKIFYIIIYHVLFIPFGGLIVFLIELLYHIVWCFNKPSFKVTKEMFTNEGFFSSYYDGNETRVYLTSWDYVIDKSISFEDYVKYKNLIKNE